MTLLSITELIQRQKHAATQQHQKRMTQFENGLETVMVIYAADINKAKAFLEATTGLKFTREQHGKGPVHWAAEGNGRVLEIYPGTGETKFLL
jgi:hypothetical protein